MKLLRLIPSDTNFDFLRFKKIAFIFSTIIIIGTFISLLINFFAPIIISQSIINNLKLAKGVIINVTSIASDNVHQFAGPAYATSKAALKSLTREMASDLAHEGIRVNAIAPGEIETSMVTPDSKKMLTEKIPMKRFGTPEEVACVIHSMCSDTFSYVNGTEIQINGGQTV